MQVNDRYTVLIFSEITSFTSKGLCETQSNIALDVLV